MLKVCGIKQRMRGKCTRERVWPAPGPLHLLHCVHGDIFPKLNCFHQLRINPIYTFIKTWCTVRSSVVDGVRQDL